MNNPTTTRPPFLKLASAVLWSFFGIRKRSNAEADVANLSLLHVVIAGVTGAAMFVFFLLSLVHVILG